MKYVIAILTIAVLTVFCLSAQTPNPLNGTWKLNLAKSKFNPPELTPKSGMSKIQINQDEIKVVTDGIDSQGRVTHAEYTAKFDGKDYPWKGTIDGKPNPNQDTVWWKKIDDYTYESGGKLKGKPLPTQHTVIARDGKSRTNTTTGTNAQGQAINNVAVYEKQ